MDYVLQPYRQYAVFSGRARRKAFWLFFLFYSVVVWLLMGIGAWLRFRDIGGWFGVAGIGYNWLPFIFEMASLLPYLGLSARRLHDSGRSAYWLFLYLPSVSFLFASFVDDAVSKVLMYAIGLVPIAVVLVLMALPGSKGTNHYGEDPIATSESS